MHELQMEQWKWKKLSHLINLRPIWLKMAWSNENIDKSYFLGAEIRSTKQEKPPAISYHNLHT